MPTQPDPNSPFLPARAEAALGVNAPGTPSMTGNPGVQAADMSYPAPPAPASGGIPGRPPVPQVPQPPAPVSAVPVPSATTPQAAPVPATPAAAASGPAAVSQAGAAPLGVPGPAGSLAMNPEAQRQFNAAVLKGRNDLGPIPRIFRHPSLPDMPFQPGQHNYNPFTGAWVTPDQGSGL